MTKEQAVRLRSALVFNWKYDHKGRPSNPVAYQQIKDLIEAGIDKEPVKEEK
jgi:hypothetical protein